MKHAVVFVVLVVAVAGCGQPQGEKAGAKGATTGGADQESRPDFASLPKQLPGKWQMGDAILEFTSGTTVIRRVRASQDIAKYEFHDGLLTITHSYRGGTVSLYGVEFISGGEVVLRPEQSGSRTGFDHLGGTWLRTSASPELAGESGPLADAKERVAKFEKKRASLGPLFEKALMDRDDLVAKLRDAGIKSVSDLKGNVQGQQLAKSLQLISGEIEGLESQMAALDSAILKAKAIARQLELKQAGIGEEEMQKLAEQLRDAEEVTGKAGNQPLTPFDIESALAKALATPPMPKGKAKAGEVDSKSSAKATSLKLVGRWQQLGGSPAFIKPTLSFTENGTITWGQENRPDEWVGKFTFDGKVLTITRNQSKVEYDVDLTATDEMLLGDKRGDPLGGFSVLEGRWKRLATERR
jgi:hypothetical protein